MDYGRLNEICNERANNINKLAVSLVTLGYDVGIVLSDRDYEQALQYVATAELLLKNIAGQIQIIKDNISIYNK